MVNVALIMSTAFLILIIVSLTALTYFSAVKMRQLVENNPYRMDGFIQSATTGITFGLAVFVLQKTMYDVPLNHTLLTNGLVAVSVSSFFLMLGAYGYYHTERIMEDYKENYEK